jgi:hypothetical protein
MFMVPVVLKELIKFLNRLGANKHLAPTGPGARSPELTFRTSGGKATDYFSLSVNSSPKSLPLWHAQ